MSKKINKLNIFNFKVIFKDRVVFFFLVKSFWKRFIFYLNIYKYLKIII